MSNLHRGEPRGRVQFETTGPSMTKQSMSAETDINNIMQRFVDGNAVTHLNKYEGNYGDFTEAPGDFHAAMNTVIKATEMFMSIPAQVRAEFRNDPGVFLDFAQDPDNLDRMRELGLAHPASADGDDLTPPKAEPGPEPQPSPEPAD